MTVKEFYDDIGGCYTEAKKRFATDSLTVKFLFKFRDDRNFPALREDIENADFASAFRHSHTLKGVALNLAFRKLSESSLALTGALRESGKTSLSSKEVGALFSDVERDYLRIVRNLDYLA